MENGRSLGLKECLVFVWCLLVLTINSLVFDYLDIDGDSAIRTQTNPVQLGRNAIYLLIGLAAALVGVSFWLATRGFVSPLLPAALAGGSAGLFFAVVSRTTCSMTISVLADLLLVVPCGRRNHCLSMAGLRGASLDAVATVQKQSRDGEV